jgi:hypothetical protein
MRILIGFCLSIFTTQAAAQSNEWKAVSTQAAATFSENVRNETAMDVAIAMLHPYYLEVAAASLGLTPQTMKTAMIQGYAHSTEMIDIVDHQVFFQAARFGNSGAFDWAVFPVQAQAKLTGDPDPFPSTCSFYVVFQDDTKLYSATISRKSERSLLFDALPEFLNLPVYDAPNCSQGTS